MDDRGPQEVPSAEVSWQWLQSLAERANAAVWTVDRDLQITASRGAGLRDLKLEQNELVGKSLFDYLQTRDESFLPIAMHRRALRGETVTYVLDWNGIICNVRLDPLRNDAGEVVGVSGVSADVTQQVRGERFLVVSQQVLEAIAKGSPLRDVLDLLTRVICTQTGNMPCAVMLFDPQTDTMKIGASAGLPPTLIRVLDGLAVGSQNGSCAAAIQTQSKVIVTDIATDPRWTLLRGEVLPQGYRACWSVPLFIANGIVVGSFAIYGTDSRGPTAQEERLLERARDLAQIAIERDRSETARREWESRLSAVLENTSDCVWAVDNQFSLLASNRAYADFCARSGLPPPVQGMPLEDLYDPELDFAGHRFWRWLFGRALQGEAFDVPHQLNVRGQSLHWLLSVAPIRSGNAVTGATVFARDITDQQQRDLLLRWCAEELSLKTGQDFFLEVVNHLVQMTGMDYAMIGSLQPGLPRRIRSIAVAAPGETIETVEYELDGTPCEDTLTEDVCVFERGVQQAYPRDQLLADLGIEGYIGTALRDRRNQRFGLLVLLSKAPLVRPTPALRALQTLAPRVSSELERQATEDALRMSEALYHSLVENIPQHIFRKDTQGRFTFANRLFCEDLHKSLDEILGRTDFDFFPRPLAQKYRTDDLRVMQTARKWATVEEHHRPGDAAPTRVQVVKTPLYDPQGQVVGVQGIFWDVT